MNNNESEESTSFIDDVFGGDAPETASETIPSTEANSKGVETESTETAENKDYSIPDDESDSFGDDVDGEDSGAKDDNFVEPGDKAPAGEKVPEKDSAELKQEVEKLQKRLHDTQAAMHKATTDRAALKKELDELKAKKENEDDWFSEDDSDREKALEADLKKADDEIARQQAEQDDLKKQEAASVWDAAAAPVIKEHPDFEKVMYEQFAPLLDAKTGNQQVIREWNELKDKSPASAYAFAKQQLDIIEFQRDPKAYKEKLLKSNHNNNSEYAFDDTPRGKEGFDMLNSEDVGSAPPERIGSFVDAVFG